MEYMHHELHFTQRNQRTFGRRSERFGGGGYPWVLALERYLFIARDKYCADTDYKDITLQRRGDYVLNRAPLYRDRRDFVVQPGDSGMPEDYPAGPARRW